MMLFWMGTGIRTGGQKSMTGDYSWIGETKAQVCKKYNLELILDDDPNVALSCVNSGISVILFKKP